MRKEEYSIFVRIRAITRQKGDHPYNQKNTGTLGVMSYRNQSKLPLGCPWWTVVCSILHQSKCFCLLQTMSSLKHKATVSSQAADKKCEYPMEYHKCCGNKHRRASPWNFRNTMGQGIRGLTRTHRYLFTKVRYQKYLCPDSYVNYVDLHWWAIRVPKAQHHRFFKSIFHGFIWWSITFTIYFTLVLWSIDNYY